jgi:putative lipoic acid-binding regulatory protein
MSDHRPPAELLEAAHEFPGVYQIKAIGTVANDFERRVVEAVAALLASPADLSYTARTTPRGGHVALTLELRVQSAEQVRTIYARLHAVEGMTMLL